ncbi:MAG TPA: methyltransferase domain-containing protein [Ignavibacteria bacterium]|nr:methyltransferase domain-containing protein [Ignavibacteria bacterium]
MKSKKEILLPGGDSQLRYTLGNIEIKGKKALVLGSGSENIALEIINKEADSVELILEDYESLLISQLNLNDIDSITPKLMDFELTDFAIDTFDIVYAQASISNTRRNKIIKEVKRILKNEGVLIVGEIIKLEKDIPQFVSDIFEQSDLEPLFVDELKNYYNSRSFEIQDVVDYTKTLKEYYSSNLSKLKSSVSELTENEKSYYKKLINQISHQSKAYLKQGADKYIGFYTVEAKLNKR